MPKKFGPYKINDLVRVSVQPLSDDLPVGTVGIIDCFYVADINDMVELTILNKDGSINGYASTYVLCIEREKSVEWIEAYNKYKSIRKKKFKIVETDVSCVSLKDEKRVLGLLCASPKGPQNKPMYFGSIEKGLEYFKKH